jgi:DNA-binding CsgD family transcriptional regulator
MQWLEYRLWARMIGPDALIALVGTGCLILGIWLGVRLTRRAPPGPFERNRTAIGTLGISPRELDVLEALATGRDNKTIARRLGVSPNTVKTHIARLFEKLDVSGRFEAIERARQLRLIPAPGDVPAPPPPPDGRLRENHPDGR